VDFDDFAIIAGLNHNHNLIGLPAVIEPSDEHGFLHRRARGSMLLPKLSVKDTQGVLLTTGTDARCYQCDSPVSRQTDYSDSSGSGWCQACHYDVAI
jgi:hypothetical protein